MVKLMGMYHPPHIVAPHHSIPEYPPHVLWIVCVRIKSLNHVMQCGFFIVVSSLKCRLSEVKIKIRYDLRLNERQGTLKARSLQGTIHCTTSDEQRL